MRGTDMWTRTFSKSYQNITKEAIWQAWADVENWPKWDTALAYCDIKCDFEAGNHFILKPAGGPKFRIWLGEVTPHSKFTAYCKLFGAVMQHIHELEEIEEGLRITHTITVQGPLAFLWTHLVAKNVAKQVPEQTDNLVQYARLKHD